MYFKANQFTGPGTGGFFSSLLRMARLAEQAGFDSLWVVDHFLIRPGKINAQFGRPQSSEVTNADPIGVWECWSLLAALAAVTNRVEIGPLVSCTAYRSPALLAKIAVTVDEISQGRLILGLGAGDYEDEHRSFGMRWDHRVSRFEEALQIIRPLLQAGRVDHHGTFYEAQNCEMRPSGPRPGGPPILIGALGHGPRMMDLTARYASMWNGWIARDSRPDAVAPLRDAVDAACVAAGRDPGSLARSLTVGVSFGGRETFGSTPLSGSAAEIADGFRGFAREGIDHLIVWLDPNTLEGVERLAEAIALVHADERGAVR